MPGPRVRSHLGRPEVHLTGVAELREAAEVHLRLAAETEQEPIHSGMRLIWLSDNCSGYRGYLLMKEI